MLLCGLCMSDPSWILLAGPIASCLQLPENSWGWPGWEFYWVQKVGWSLSSCHSFMMYPSALSVYVNGWGQHQLVLSLMFSGQPSPHSHLVPNDVFIIIFMLDGIGFSSYITAATKIHFHGGYEQQQNCSTLQSLTSYWVFITIWKYIAVSILSYISYETSHLKAALEHLLHMEYRNQLISTSSWTVSAEFKKKHRSCQRHPHLKIVCKEPTFNPTDS